VLASLAQTPTPLTEEVLRSPVEPAGDLRWLCLQSISAVDVARLRGILWRWSSFRCLNDFVSLRG
jgi:hypothetical protein